MIVVSDTSPICYLLLINRIELLHTLYGIVIIPPVVAHELGAAGSPPVVKSWIAHPPGWLQIQWPDALLSETLDSQELKMLDPGEREAILLAERLNADLVLLDDKAARQMAVERRLRIIGLLGILKDAARNDLLNLEATFTALQKAGFWVAPSLLERLLADD